MLLTIPNHQAPSSEQLASQLCIDTSVQLDARDRERVSSIVDEIRAFESSTAASPATPVINAEVAIRSTQALAETESSALDGMLLLSAVG